MGKKKTASAQVDKPPPAIKPPDRPQWAKRIVGSADVSPAELVAHNRNWRNHPAAQADALKGAIDEVGFIRSVTVNKRSGRILDGHLRIRLALDSGQLTIPVEYVDLSPDEELKALLILDPIAARAKADPEKLASLLAEVEMESESLQSLIDDLTEKEKAEKKKEREVEFKQEFSILIRCDTEDDQRDIIGELDRHGLNVKAMVVDLPVADSKPAELPPVREGEVEIVRESSIRRSPRVMQLEGMFDVPPSQRAEERWRVKAKLDRPWQIGLIVGASGSTLAREMFSDNLVGGWSWPKSKALVDGFPAGMSIAEVTGLLSSVGFSSPPGWLKPFRVLSNGEQFRVNLARTLAEMPELAVVDEFTSVVDRTVAKIGSAAVAKAIRASGRRFVAVSCHSDIEEWLQPDWKIEMPAGALVWRSLQRRPQIQLQIERTHWKTWEAFRRHHYLDHQLNRASKCFLAKVEGRPAAFTAVLHNPHASGGFWREHRTVCHPDFQGAGIGNAMSEFVASLFVATDKAYRSTTSHPAMIRHRLRSLKWNCVRTPGMGPTKSPGTISKSRAVYRLTASFEYIAPANFEQAEVLGVMDCRDECADA